MIWIKIRDKTPVNSDVEVRYAYLQHDGNIKDHGDSSTGWILNRFASLYPMVPATLVQSEMVWQYANATTTH